MPASHPDRSTRRPGAQRARDLGDLVDPGQQRGRRSSADAVRVDLDGVGDAGRVPGLRVELTVARSPGRPSTGHAAIAWPSRKVSLRTHRATATCSTPAPLRVALDRPRPSSVQACGTDPAGRRVGAQRAPAREHRPGSRSAIDGLPAAGLLADLAGEVEPLERELDGAGPLAVVARRRAGRRPRRRARTRRAPAGRSRKSRAVTCSPVVTICAGLDARRRAARSRGRGSAGARSRRSRCAAGG